MAARPRAANQHPRQPGGWERAHIDLGALDQRVSNTERAIQSIAEQVGRLQDDTRASFDRLTTDLGARIDKQAAKPTNLLQLGGFMISLFVAFGGFAWYAKSGIDTSIAEDKSDLRDEARERKSENDKIYLTLAPIAAVAAQHTSDLSAAVSQQADNLRQFKAIEAALETKWSRDAQTEYEKREDQIVALEHEYDQRDFDRLLGRVNTLDGELIKRPEIEAIDNGLRNEISTNERSLEEVRREIGSAYTWGDELKSLRAQVETLSGRIFSSLSAPTIAPIAPIAPLAPVVPK